mgnify:CR=1 FL=1
MNITKKSDKIKTSVVEKIRKGYSFMGEKKKHKRKLLMNFGISQSYISRLEKKIIKKMKKEIMSKTG